MRKLSEVPALLVLGYLFWITYWAFNGPDRLPARVPTHFDVSGRPNAWGSPGSLWVLPAVGLGLYLLITALASIQFRTFNLTVRVTEVNLAFVQQKTREMVALFKMEMVCLFAYVQSGIIHGMRIGAFRLSPVILPVFMVAILATIAIYMVIIIRGARACAESVATTEYVGND